MFQQMKYLIAVVDKHSFTRAAESCHVSQSAISQQIKELEGSLGITLLERKGRSFLVTPAGQYFYQQAQQILKQVVVNTRQIANQEADEYVLKLGYMVNFGTQEFLQSVASFSKRYPKVKVQITSGMHERLFELLRTDKIDLDFADQRRALSPEYQNEYLTETDFMSVIPQGQFADQDHVTTAELAVRPCILVVGSTQEAAEEAYCRNVLGIQSSFLTAATFGEAQMMVAANQGFTIVNSRTVGQVDTAAVSLLPLFNGKTPLHQKYYAYWKRDNSGYYIEAFAKLLKQQFR